MDMNELNATAQNLISVRQMIEELQAEAEALTDKIKAAMVEQGTEALQGDGGRQRGAMSTAAALIPNPLSRITLTCTASTAGPPQHPALC